MTSRQRLYHGTCFPNSILSSGVIRFARIGDPAVSLTRDKRVAHRFASMPRDDAEKTGAILILDWDSLRCRYRIEPFNYGMDACYGYGHREESEEAIWERDVNDLHRHLVDVEWVALEAT
jgi:hypothetical protein